MDKNEDEKIRIKNTLLERVKTVFSTYFNDINPTGIRRKQNIIIKTSREKQLLLKFEELISKFYQQTQKFKNIGSQGFEEQKYGRELREFLKNMLYSNQTNKLGFLDEKKINDIRLLYVSLNQYYGLTNEEENNFRIFNAVFSRYFKCDSYDKTNCEQNYYNKGVNLTRTIKNGNINKLKDLMIKFMDDDGTWDLRINKIRFNDANALANHVKVMYNNETDFLGRTSTEKNELGSLYALLDSHYFLDINDIHDTNALGGKNHRSLQRMSHVRRRSKTGRRRRSTYQTRRRCRHN